MKAHEFTVVVTEATRTATLRRVFFTLPHVAPPGVEWTAPHKGRRFELTSFKGGPVEVYCFNEETGLPMYQGTVRRYAPGLSLRAAFRQAWYEGQKSKAARASFEASAAEEAMFLPGM